MIYLYVLTAVILTYLIAGAMMAHFLVTDFRVKIEFETSKEKEYKKYKELGMPKETYDLTVCAFIELPHAKEPKNCGHEKDYCLYRRSDN